MRDEDDDNYSDDEVYSQVSDKKSSNAPVVQSTAVV